MTIDALAAALADRYRLEREIGVGGMATVYLAQDVKHHRKVAIKVLHPELSAVIGSERFLKEIELTANLQHPHILPLFDSGMVEGRGGRDADYSSPSSLSTPSTFLYYVMPFVEGETLRHRLERERQLSVADAVRITTEVADALDYAHRHGAVHRDIKPENILLHDGRPVVADFGIALAVQHAGGTRMTQTGMSLGTPQYMAPEQAMGDRNVDHRVDIYALGAVAYEMLAGEPPFTGPSSQAIVARVMTERPRGLRAIRDTIPAHVADAVQTALQKLPADRFPSAAEFARALATPTFHAASESQADGAVPLPAERNGRRSVARGALVLLLAGLAAWGWLRSGASAPRAAGWRVAIQLPDSAPPTTGVDLSADASFLVYGGGTPEKRRIWVRRADAPNPIPIPGTEGGESPAISPDGRRIAFRRAFSIFVVPFEGGTPVLAADSVVLNERPSWVDDGHLVISNFAGIERIDIENASRELIIPRDTLSGFYGSPVTLPGGALLLTVQPLDNIAELSGYNIAIAGPGERPTMLMRGVVAHFVPPDHLFVFRSDGSLVHLPFDVSDRRVRGPGRTILSGIPVVRGNITGSFDVARTGRVALIFGGRPRGIQLQDLVRVSRSGGAVPIDTGWTGGFVSAVVSPDGRLIAVGAQETTEQIQLRESAGGGRSRIAIPSLQLRGPTFSPDGERLVFAGLGAHGMGIYQARADGSTTPELIFPTAEPVTAPAFTPGGDAIYYSTFGTTADVFFQPLRDGGHRQAVIASRARERYGFPSPPVGAWLAYTSDESGPMEMYVRSSDPARAERWQLTHGGVDRLAMPRWSRDGRELFYIGRDTMIAVRIATGPSFGILRRTALFSTARYQEAFDVFPGGDFLMIRPRPFDRDAHQMVMLEHWNPEAQR